MNGTAAHHLEIILKEPSIEVVGVIFSQGLVKSKYRKIIQKCKKLFKIGLLGALNGIRMRKWYQQDLSDYLHIKNLQNICQENSIPFFKTERINSEQTITLFKNTKADIGLSLGNGYIAKKVFTILPFGMLNIHHELLPDYQNAQSVIWQIYNGSKNTGYTIHKINEKIDAGEILFQETIPIQLKDTFASTVTATYAQILKQSAEGLVRVLKSYETFLQSAITQAHGHSYTTPSFWQYLKMKSQFIQLKKQSVIEND